MWGSRKLCRHHGYPPATLIVHREPRILIGYNIVNGKCLMMITPHFFMLSLLSVCRILQVDTIDLCSLWLQMSHRPAACNASVSASSKSANTRTQVR